MSNLVRLTRLFARRGIQVEYQNGIYQVSNPTGQAQILLPASLPLEHKAVQQLLAFASVADSNDQPRVCKACATPDFHPGSIAPVGSIVATDADFVIPAAIGTDINCGMRLVALDIPMAQLSAHKHSVITRLQRVLLESGRDVPATAAAYHALFEQGPAAFIELLPKQGLWASANRDQLQRELAQCIGLAELQAKAKYAPSALTEERGIIRDPCLGTPGGGNHFVELQHVEQLFDRQQAWQLGLREGDAVLMVHSGSRDLGFYVGSRWMERARQAWPTGKKHPVSGLYGLSGPLASEYLSAMGVAARYAWANRMTLVELVRHELAQLGLLGASRLLVDVPHNVVLTEAGLNIHRKGATPARTDDLALIPGSMGDSSYLVNGLGHADWLWSCSHGAGRAVRRQSTRMLKPSAASAVPSWHCVTLKQQRLVEESPAAYKPIGPVIEAQQQAGLINPIVALKPWLTFKA